MRNYNSGCALVDGRLYLVTRRFDNEAWRSRLVINRLDGTNLERVKVLELPSQTGFENFEDGRLFQFNNKWHVAYTEGLYWAGPSTAIQRVAVLSDDWEVEQVVTISYGKNGVPGEAEKNWQFFVNGGRLCFVYSISPHIVVELEGYTPVRSYQTDSELSPEFRGGTPPVLTADGFVSFFHFHLPHKRKFRRYAMASYAFGDEPPFAPQRVSQVLVWGSENDPFIPNMAYPHWNPLVVFPCGAVINHHGWLVTAGINDSFDVLFEIPHHRLQWRPITTKFTQSVLT